MRRKCHFPGDFDWLQLHRAYAQQSHLRRVQDRREALDAQRAEVADGEAAAPQLVGQNLARATSLRQFLRAFRQRPQRELVGIAQHGYQQAAFRINRLCQMHSRILVDGVVFKERVEDRELRQGAGNGK